MSEFLEENLAIIEGMLFLAGDEGLSVKEIRTVLNMDEASCKAYLSTLKKQLEERKSCGLQLVFLAGKYKLATKEKYRSFFEKMVHQSTAPLSNAAMEVLAIIAYNQPVTRLNIEEIRGVGSDANIRRMLARAFIREVGREDSPGKPILYGVTDQFMDAFDLATLDELPALEELMPPEQSDHLFDFRYQEEATQE